MVTETEKLRALLAEARGVIDEGLDRDKPSVVERIDAALAEPVEGPLNAISRLQQQLHEAKSNADWLVQQAQRERDEARADASLAEARLVEIVALVGEGGDGSAFGSVESMLATFTHRQEVLQKQRDEARAELDFIKAEYGGADDDSLTRDALLLKLRLLESEMDAERASRRMYERSHDDILEALKRAEADAYHPEDGEPVALWGVERLAKQRDEARAEVERAFRRGAEAMREAAAQLVDKMLSHTLTDAADRIRALPIPEDRCEPKERS